MEKQWNHFEQWFLNKAVKQKLKEFHRAGYLNVIDTEIWDYAVERMWKKQSPSFKECKQDIEAITINDFFDYQQVKVQIQSAKFFDFSDIQDLL
ncbi:post-transcriptional regulator [Vagococcus xieshaowenii]|uniref:Post-transcriptional regulator n=1 Tax=Vagococcus xieshaowenii TaxID=2562451 RepID=A0AAJ5EFU6_9ENTE|nr:post-transcriptional regulator [Vagococcus xieshaowenii]QCA27990.1 hypothetical protein E4Z98_00965 [Vagococcus xieshaowenii]TFZ41243.1 hypothetical protein E4031_05160 [Vagococcus xieshaowenii]